MVLNFKTKARAWKDWTGKIFFLLLIKLQSCKIKFLQNSMCSCEKRNFGPLLFTFLCLCSALLRSRAEVWTRTRPLQHPHSFLCQPACSWLAAVLGIIVLLHDPVFRVLAVRLSHIWMLCYIEEHSHWLDDCMMPRPCGYKKPKTVSSVKF